MIDFAEYQSRLQQALDERRDPLDDAEVQSFLEAHPEHLQAFVEQRDVLEQIALEQFKLEPASGPPVAFAAPAPQQRRRPWLLAAAAAIVTGATLFGAGWWAAHAVDGNATDPDSNARIAKEAGDSPRRSRILSATLQEVAPNVRPAASYTVRDRLVKTPTMTLEAYEHRSELR